MPFPHRLLAVAALAAGLGACSHAPLGLDAAYASLPPPATDGSGGSDLAGGLAEEAGATADLGLDPAPPGTPAPRAAGGEVEPLAVLARSHEASARWRGGADRLGSIASSLPSKAPPGTPARTALPTGREQPRGW